MVIRTRTERDFIAAYLTAIQGEFRLVPRELEIAILFVCKYRRLSTAYAKLTTTQAKEKYNVTKMLTSGETVQEFIEELNMEFSTFRNYVTNLKKKKFFLTGGKINPLCLPEETSAKIEIVYE